jgi:regulator of cell morphogenesis and NO signaling
MTIDTDKTVGQLAAEHPPVTMVFSRHHIDYCCGGGVSLREACERRGLDLAVVLDEIQRTLASPAPSEERWDEAPFEALIEHIVTVYHGSLREELPRLESMARKVCETHRDKEPEMLPELLSVYVGLKAELDEHMMKEEQILFPMIARGQGFMADAPISVMEHEHDSAARALRRLRQLTNDYRVPAEACTTWRALWHGLAALEEALHRHIHLENNILFPRALAL